MVLHADLCWLEVSTRDLWPLELNYDTYLHNYTPRKETGIPPDENGPGPFQTMKNSGLTKPGDVLLIY